MIFKYIIEKEILNNFFFIRVTESGLIFEIFVKKDCYYIALRICTYIYHDKVCDINFFLLSILNYYINRLNLL